MAASQHTAENASTGERRSVSSSPWRHSMSNPASSVVWSRRRSQQASDLAELHSLSARRTSTGTVWEHDRVEAEPPVVADQPMGGKSSLEEIEDCG